MRHKLPLLCVISLDGGWTARPRGQQARPRSRLHALRLDGRGARLLRRICQEPEDIRPALQRAWRKVEEGIVGFVNVKTDCRARATAVRFSSRDLRASGQHIVLR